MTEIEQSPFDPDWHADDGTPYPWAPHEKESPLAYGYFAIYLRLGPGRSIGAAAREAGKSREFFKELSPRYSWVDRAQAFDAHLDRKTIESIVRGRTKMREDHLSIAEIAREKLIARVKAMDPEEFSVRDAATWLDLVVKLERQARGEADKTLKIEGQIDMVGQLTTSERRELMNQARKVLNSRLGIKEIEAPDGIVDADVVEGDD